MTRTTYRLALALLLSLLLHISPFIGEFVRLPPTVPPPPPIRAEIRAPALPPPPPLELDKPEPAAAPAKEATMPKSGKRQTPLPDWQQEIRRQFKKQQKDGLFYPAEAIAQGLEGEVQVLLVLDENGQLAAARVEHGSGYRLLDDAALKAVRALHSLPADAPRQAVIPVLFRLH